MVCKYRGDKILHMKDIFFTFNLHGMQTNRWQIFREKGYLFNINSKQINSSRNFTDKGHLFYIQAPW